MAQRKYNTSYPTQFWQTKRARVDLVEKMEAVAKLLQIPVVQLFNEILEKELSRMTAITVEQLLAEREQQKIKQSNQTLLDI